MEELAKNLNECKYCNKPLFKKDGKPTGNIKFLFDTKETMHEKCYLENTPEEKLSLCLFCNCMSIGDTISHTPIIREIKRIYPDTPLDVLTYVPEVFKYNPYIRNIIPADKEKIKEDFFFQYDKKIMPFQPYNPQFPLHMAMHSVDFVSLGTFRKILQDKDKHYEMPFTYVESNNMKRICNNNKINLEEDNLIVIHPHGAHWGTRSWGQYNWQKFVDSINFYYPNHKIISIGGSRNMNEYKMDNKVELAGVTDMYDKFSLLELLAFFEFADAFITFDTGPLHLAGASNCPVLAVFTVVHSEYRLPYRSGVKGHNMWWIDSKDCVCAYDHKFLTHTFSIDKCPKHHDPIKCLPEHQDLLEKLQEIL